jgi:hypothetical protein
MNIDNLLNSIYQTVSVAMSNQYPTEIEKVGNKIISTMDSLTQTIQPSRSKSVENMNKLARSTSSSEEQKYSDELSNSSVSENIATFSRSPIESDDLKNAGTFSSFLSQADDLKNAGTFSSFLSQADDLKNAGTFSSFLSQADDLKNANSFSSFLSQADDLIFVYNEKNFDNTDKKEEIASQSNKTIQNHYVRESNKIIEMTSNFCILFSSDLVIQEMLDSYSGNGKSNAINNIMEQAKVDFPRMDVHYGSIYYKHLNAFQTVINKFQYKRHKLLPSIYHLLMMLITQSSFYYPFKLVHDVYTLPDSNQYVMQESDRPYINIIEHKHAVEITFKKTFKYLDVDTNQVLKKFHTLMIMTIDHYGYKTSDAGMLYWIIEKN